MCRPAVKALQLEAASQLHQYQLHLIMQNRHRLDAIGLTAVASLQLLACKDEADAVLRPCNFSCICFCTGCQQKYPAAPRLKWSGQEVSSQTPPSYLSPAAHIKMLDRTQKNCGTVQQHIWWCGYQLPR